MFINKRLAVQACAVGFAALFLLPQSAAVAADQQPGVRMTYLPVPPNVTTSTVTGGDHTGHQLAGMGSIQDTNGSTGVALQWVDGRVRVVDTSAVLPYVGVDVNDVNSHGVVIGHRTTDSTSFHTDAWVYRAGRATLLPALHPGDDTRALAINTRGDIVGFDGAAVDGVYRGWAVLWPVDRPGTVRELIVAGESPEYATAVDIDDDGTILGFVGLEPSEQQYPYVWPARGQGYRLAAPEGTGYPKGAAVHNGLVVGYAIKWEGNEGHSCVARWDLRSGTAKLVTTAPSTAIAVNRQGVIAGPDALYYPNGTQLQIGYHITVLSDHHTAAGGTSFMLMGRAVMWVGV